MAKRCPTKSTQKATVECTQEPAIIELQASVKNIKTVLGYNGDKNIPVEATVRGRLDKAVTYATNVVVQHEDTITNLVGQLPDLTDQ